MSTKSQELREIFEEYQPTFFGRASGPRTPLHVEFAGNDSFVPSETLDIGVTYPRNLAQFNAVGSRTVKAGSQL